MGRLVEMLVIYSFKCIELPTKCIHFVRPFVKIFTHVFVSFTNNIWWLNLVNDNVDLRNDPLKPVVYFYIFTYVCYKRLLNVFVILVKKAFQSQK